MHVREVLRPVPYHLEVRKKAGGELGGEHGAGGESGEKLEDLSLIDGKEEDFATHGSVNRGAHEAHGGEDGSDMEAARGKVGDRSFGFAYAREGSRDGVVNRESSRGVREVSVVTGVSGTEAKGLGFFVTYVMENAWGGTENRGGGEEVEMEASSHVREGGIHMGSGEEETLERGRGGR